MNPKLKLIFPILMNLLVEEFKCFLMGVGFSPETVEMIQIVEE